MIGIRFDLRVPPFAQTTHAELYAACLDQCAWADEHGLDIVALSEHHGVDDGYLPAPVTLAAAIAGRTKQIRINIAAVLVPLHDPVRLAEQLAVLDLVSGGRVSFVAGLGYRQEEFDMAGVDRTQRGKLLEEYVAVMRQAWTGEPFEWRGRTVRVTPKPKSPPMILDRRLDGDGGAARGTAACRLLPGDRRSAARRRLQRRVRAARLQGGFVIMPGGPGFVHVTEDPERDWARIAPHALYDAQTYAAWQTPDQRSSVHVEAQTIDDVRKSGVYRVVTPDECVALANEMGRVLLHPLMGGMPPELGWQGLELFESKVLPRIR